MNILVFILEIFTKLKFKEKKKTNYIFVWIYIGPVRGPGPI